MKTKAACLLLLICCCLPLNLAAQPAAAFKIERLISFLTLGTGAMTGTYFPLGNAFANAWTTHSDNLSVMSHSTRGSIDNIRLLQQGELNLAIAQSDIVIAALGGRGSFTGRTFSDLRVLMALYPEVVQIVVAADSDIVNLAQLRGRRVIVGPPGSGNALTAVELLAACGIGPADFTPAYISYDDMIQAMERRENDAAIVIAGIPTMTISELQKRLPLRIISFSSAEIASLTKALPYLSGLSLPEATYKTGSGNLETLALMAMLVCDAHLSEDLAYRLCRDMYSHLDYLKKIHERARDITPENFMKGVPPGSLHPGAARFYGELRQKP